MRKKILAVVIDSLLFRGCFHSAALPDYEWHIRHLSTESLIAKVKEERAKAR